MPYTNVHRNARISPKKAKLITDAIRGRSIDDALRILDLSKQRAAVMVRAALLAAQSNAEQDEADTRRLVVTDARVDKGITLKRFQPKDRGRAHPILKRCSHITVSVDQKQQATATT